MITSKNYQWMLKPVDRCMMRNKVSALSQSIHPTKYLLITKIKVITLQWRNLEETTLAIWSMLAEQGTSNTDHVYPLIWYADKGTILFYDIPVKMDNLNLITRKQTNLNWGLFYKGNSQLFFKCWVTKNKERLRSCHRLEENEEIWQLNAMDPGLDPEPVKRTGEKNNIIQRKCID